MTDIKDITENKFSLIGKRTLSLKGIVNQNQVKSSFSQSRSNSVIVETKRKRIIRPTDVINDADNVFNKEKPINKEPLDSGLNNSTLTTSEQDARTQALIESKNKEKKLNEGLDQVLREDLEINSKKNKGTDDKDNVNIPKKIATDTGEENSRKNKRSPVSEDSIDYDEEGGKKTNLKQTKTLGQDERRKIKLTVTRALDDTPRHRSLASIRRRRERDKRQSLGFDIQQKISREVILPEEITIQEQKKN